MKRSKNLKNSTIIKKFQLSTYKDDRGSFIKIYSLVKSLKKNIDLKVNQINYSTNLKKGTIRGLHYQTQPKNDKKIIICLEGEIFDVIVNIKKKSKDFLKTYKFRLKGENKDCLFIPKGYAHGYQTLTNNTKLLYIHSDEYYKKYDRGINPFDKTLKIKWPLNVSKISTRDMNFDFINKNYEGLK